MKRDDAIHALAQATWAGDHGTVYRLVRSALRAQRRSLLKRFGDYPAAQRPIVLGRALDDLLGGLRAYRMPTSGITRVVDYAHTAARALPRRPQAPQAPQGKTRVNPNSRARGSTGSQGRPA